MFKQVSLKEMALSAFYTFRGQIANLYSCIHGMAQSQESCKMNAHQNPMKTKNYNAKNKIELANDFLAKMRHILSVTFVEKAQVACQLFALLWFTDTWAFKRLDRATFIAELFV